MILYGAGGALQYTDGTVGLENEHNWPARADEDAVETNSDDDRDAKGEDAEFIEALDAMQNEDEDEQDEQDDIGTVEVNAGLQSVPFARHPLGWGLFYCTFENKEWAGARKTDQEIRECKTMTPSATFQQARKFMIGRAKAPLPDGPAEKAILSAAKLDKYFDKVASSTPPQRYPQVERFEALEWNLQDSVIAKEWTAMVLELDVLGKDVQILRSREPREVNPLRRADFVALSGPSTAPILEFP